jgi:hypothetical protein
MTSSTTTKNIADKFQQNLSSTPMRLLLICVVGLLVWGSFIVYHKIYPTSYYTSTQDSFKINFPIKPVITSVPPKSVSSGGTDTVRVYNAEDQQSKTDYGIYVIHYSSINFSKFSVTETKDTLAADVNELAKAQSADLSNGKFIKFEGLTAAQALLVPATNKSIVSARVTAFLKGNNFYMIIGSGLTQQDYNTFTSTFSFVK